MRYIYSLFVFLCILLSEVHVEAQNAFLESRFSYYSYEDEISFIYHDPVDFSLSNTELRVDDIKHYFSIRRLTPKVSLLSISIDKLDMGDHNVVLMVKDQAVASCRFSILHSQINEVKLDKLSGGLIVDRRPFYPLGFYTRLPMDQVIKREVYHGFNMVGPYQNLKKNNFESRKAYMDLCHQLGLKVNYAVNSIVNEGNIDTKKDLDKETGKSNLELLQEEVLRMKDHPALLSWYLSDEPVGQGRDPRYLEKAYNLIHTLDPYHPITMVFMTPSRASEFDTSMDIAMTDPYPIPGPIDEIPQSVNVLMNQFEYRKGVWYVPQTFGGGEFWEREPTEQEIRAMCYSAIQQGAMGLQAFIKKGVNEFPKSITSWNGYVKVVNEIQMLMPWLNSRAMRQELTTENSDILASYWRRDDSGLLIVVNKSNKPMNFNVALPSSCREEKVEVMFENRTLPFNNAYVSDMIDALGVRVYKIYEPKDKSNNLLSFGDFEEFSSASTPSSCYARNSSFDGSRYFLDATSYYEGHYSLCFFNNGSDSEMGLSFYRTLVSPNQGYHLSFCAKSETLSTDTLFIELKGIDKKIPFILTPEWKRYDYQFSTKDNSSQISIGIISKVHGRCWVDNIEMYYDPFIMEKKGSDNTSLVVLKKHGEGTLLYRTTIMGHKSRWRKYRLPIKVNKTTLIEAKLEVKGKVLNYSSKMILNHLGMKGNLKLNVPASDKYPGLSKGKTLIDGKFATPSYFDKNWQGYEGIDLAGVIDLCGSNELEQIRFNFLDDVNDGIHLPKQIKVFGSLDGKHFKQISETSIESSKPGKNVNKVVVLCPLKTKTRYIKYVVETTHIIPEGFLFKGSKAWTFIDEIEVY
ncbi:hypothetical protein K4L44_17080 [Halosquirtibacter laminarini]|uniref:Uncharacterized protein n=1 Tax=Halosquirtibacter laminarini TaxID=3374600 RepID=A0AC61NF15_9BACT|nr:hypothetical protein K4L44_17080 [Prolixibacteraceae bacterium]